MKRDLILCGFRSGFMEKNASFWDVLRQYMSYGKPRIGMPSIGMGKPELGAPIGIAPPGLEMPERLPLPMPELSIRPPFSSQPGRISP